jgi:hypothetical protein
MGAVDPWLNVVIAVVVGALILKIGAGMLGSFARPIPEPPPAGELRKVKLRYRCPMCGMEIRIDRAGDELPEPPRHCMDEMELVATPDL